jgi:hypothetical protein
MQPQPRQLIRAPFLSASAGVKKFEPRSGYCLLEVALDSGAKYVLIPSENKRDLAQVPDEVLNKLQAIFYTDPINAMIRGMGLKRFVVSRYEKISMGRNRHGRQI